MPWARISAESRLLIQIRTNKYVTKMVISLNMWFELSHEQINDQKNHNFTGAKQDAADRHIVVTSMIMRGVCSEKSMGLSFY